MAEIYSYGETCPACILVYRDPHAHRLRQHYRDHGTIPWLWYEGEAGQPRRRFCRVCGVEWQWLGGWVLVRDSDYIIRGPAQGGVQRGTRRQLSTVRA